MSTLSIQIRIQWQTICQPTHQMIRIRCHHDNSHIIQITARQRQQQQQQPHHHHQQQQQQQTVHAHRSEQRMIIALVRPLAKEAFQVSTLPRIFTQKRK